MTPAFAGALAGLLHVVSGPDHLVAVAPLAINRPSIGARIGLFWGLGHATGVIVLGIIGVLGRSLLPVHQLSSWSEVLVGGALTGIGVWAFWQSRAMVVHRHAHTHLREARVNHLSPAHEHLHVHVAREPHTATAHRHHKRGAYAVGILHGAAGTGHLLGVVPALALTTPQGVTYLSAYGLAAVGAMTGFGAVLGAIGHRIAPHVLSATMRSCGILAIAMGLYWIVAGWP